MRAIRIQIHLRFIIPAIFGMLLAFPIASFSQADTTEIKEEEPPSEWVEEYIEKIKKETGDEEVYDEEGDVVFTETIFLDSIRLQKREIDKSEIDKLKASDAFWYADVEPETPKVRKEEKVNQRRYVPVLKQTWFQTLLWLVIVGGFAIAVAMYLSNSNVKLFSRKNVIVNDDTAELETEDIFAINYQKEIDKAVARKDYRLGVRLMYLRLLKNMSDRNIIKYSQGKTNFDYLSDLQPTSYYSNFFRVTRHYEYSWYGYFDVSSEAYSRITTEFANMEKSFY